MVAGIVYKIINMINYKVYIGITTKDLYERWRQHKNSIVSKRERKQHLYLAMQHYGIDNFIIVKIDQAKTLDELFLLEIKYIEQYNTNDRKWGYNKSIGGEYNTVSPEGLKKLSDKSKERWSNPEYRLMMIKSLTGVKKLVVNVNKGKHGTYSIERLKKMSESRKGKCVGKDNYFYKKGPMLGKKFTTEHREKIAQKLLNNKNGKVGKEHHASKQIRCIDTGEIFINVSEAKKKYPKGNLYKAATSGRTSCGMRWEYMN